MAVPATMKNATTNATPGSPPASAIAVAAAAAAAADNDDGNNGDNEDNNNDSVNLDTLCRRVRDLRPMLDASADRLADTEANAAVTPVECARTLELAKRRAGERICQDKEELRRTRIEAKKFRVGWTRLRAAVGGRGRKRRAEGALALSSAAAAAKANDAPPLPVTFWGTGRVSASPPPARPPPTSPLIVVVAEDPRRDVVGEGFYQDSTAYAGIQIRGLVAGQRRSHSEVDDGNVPAGLHGGG